MKRLSTYVTVVVVVVVAEQNAHLHSGRKEQRPIAGSNDKGDGPLPLTSLGCRYDDAVGLRISGDTTKGEHKPEIECQRNAIAHYLQSPIRACIMQSPTRPLDVDFQTPSLRCELIPKDHLFLT